MNIYRRSKETAEDFIYNNFVHSFLKQKADRKKEVALETLWMKGS